jgi:hypothetical protein
MKILAASFILVSLAFAQDKPNQTRVEWNASLPGALRKLSDGRTQRTVASKFAVVSMIADRAEARRFLDPPLDGGPDVTYIVIGIRNLSEPAYKFDPATVKLRVVGKNERELERFTEEQVVYRAWQRNDNNPSALPAMSGGMKNVRVGRGVGHPDTDSTVRLAVTGNAQDRSNRIAQQKSEQQTTAQARNLSDRSLLAREVAPGESVMGMVFFYPFENSDKLELTIPVGETTFVIPFTGREAKKK